MGIFPSSATEPLAAPGRTRALLEERVRALLLQLPRAVAGDIEAVHQLRVGCRRLRVSLPLLSERPRAKRARRLLRALRELGRAAAASRDLDVMTATFDEAAGDPARTALRRRLVAARRQRRALLPNALLDLDLAALRRGLLALKLEPEVAERDVLARLQAAALGQIERANEDLAELRETFDAVGLHELRIRFRHLRYLAEVHEELAPSSNRLAERLRTQQQLLGALHDAWILADWCHALELRLRSSGPEALGVAAGREARRWRARARQEHRAWLGSSPRDALAATRLEFGL